MVETPRFALFVLAALLAAGATTGVCAAPSGGEEESRPLARRGLSLGRTFDASTSGVVNEAARVAKPPIISREQWGGGPSSSSLLRAHTPAFLTLHHAGDPKPLTAQMDPKKKLRNLLQWGWKEKNWPDIPYHYVIDLEGNIYEARDPLAVGDTSTAYNPTGHLLVTLMGNYELQAPNEKQLSATADLMAWLSDYYNVDPQTLRGHMDYADTACPGKYLYPFVASGFLEGEVRARIRSAYGDAETSGADARQN